MSDLNQTQASTAEPILERASRVERAVLHVAKAIELELADVALSNIEFDGNSQQAESLREMGATLVRIASIGFDTAQRLATTLDEEKPELALSEAVPRTTSNPLLSPKQLKETAQDDELKNQQLQDTSTDRYAPAEPVEERAGSSRLTTNQSITKTKTEKVQKNEQQFEGLLYQRIVSEKETPILELREGMVEIPVRIISDDTLVINGEKVILEGDKLFIFNALMKLRDTKVTPKQMRALGFRLENARGSTVFSAAMADLMAELQQAAGPEQRQDLIKRIGKGRGTQYAVNPAITLYDERLEVADALGETPESVKKN